MADSTTDVPITGDSGIDYGSELIDLFKFGVGAYFNNRTQQFESKTKYDALNGQLYQNGQSAGLGLTSTGMNYLPWALGAAVLIIAVVLLKE